MLLLLTDTLQTVSLTLYTLSTHCNDKPSQGSASVFVFLTINMRVILYLSTVCLAVWEAAVHQLPGGNEEDRGGL